MAGRQYDKDPSDIALSPSSAKFLDICPAGYLYNKHLLPAIYDSDESEAITKCGSLFHEWAETGFDPLRFDAICKDADDDDMVSIMEYARVVQNRWYFTETDFDVEKYVKLYIKDTSWLLRGYIDRVVRVGKLWYIIDYKTTWNPNPNNDVRQLRIYAYLIHKTLGIAAENIKLILDYVQDDAMYPFDVTNQDLVLTGNYIMSAFIRAQAIVDEYAKHKNMHMIYHRPGSMCTFCHMVGNCLAYKAYHNPAFQDPDHDAEMSISDMVSELQLRQESVKVNTARVTMLKRTLMQKIDEADAGNDLTTKKAILAQVSVRSRKDKYIVKSALLKRLVPELVKNGFKRQQMKGMFDTQKIELKLEELISDYLPETLKLSQIPKDVLAQNTDLVRTIQRNKYIQVD